MCLDIYNQELHFGLLSLSGDEESVDNNSVMFPFKEKSASIFINLM